MIVKFLSVLFFVFGLATVSAAQVDDPRLPANDMKFVRMNSEPMIISKVYVPGGFDSNDTVEVVAQGFLPNPCWQIDKAYYLPNKQNNSFTVFVMAYNNWPKRACGEFLVNFEETIKIGQLKKDDYTIWGKSKGDDKNALLKTFHVKEKEMNSDNPDGADAHMYAPIDAVVHKVKKDGTVDVSLHGTFPRLEKGCMFIEEVEPIKDADDVLAVLPKVHIDEKCNPDTAEFDFEQTFTVPEKFKDSFLLHVRSLNGSSINKVVRLKR